MRFSICFLYLIFFAAHLQAESSVWMVEQKGRVVYLVGTIHLLNESDHPLPDEYEQAYQASDQLYFETDLEAASSPSFHLKFLQALSVKKGETLESSLKPSTYMALKVFLAGRDIPVESFEYYSPAGITLMLSLMEYQRMGMVANYGVDLFYQQKAKKDGKAIGQLESLDAQLEFIAGMGEGQEDEMVLYTIQELDKNLDFVGELKALWRAGDIAEMDKVALIEMREKFNSTYQSLIVKRNNNWLPEIQLMLEDVDTEAVMVGALHLAGPDGLVALLKAKGYKVKKL